MKYIEDKYNEINGTLRKSGIILPKTSKRIFDVTGRSPIWKFISLDDVLRYPDAEKIKNTKSLLGKLDILPKKLESCMKKVSEFEMKKGNEASPITKDTLKRMEILEKFMTGQKKSIGTNIQYWNKNLDLDKYLELIHDKVLDTKRCMDKFEGFSQPIKNPVVKLYGRLLALGMHLQLIVSFYASICKSMEEMFKLDEDSLLGIIGKGEDFLLTFVSTSLKVISVVATLLPIAGGLASKVCESASKAIDAVAKVAEETNSIVEQSIKAVGEINGILPNGKLKSQLIKIEQLK